MPWPDWVPAGVTEALAGRGIRAPWSHQASAASFAWASRNVIISTGAASGKSLGYLLPALTSVLAGDTVLYVTPTKALAADQLASIRSLSIPGVVAAIDGDSRTAERAWARSHARYLLTTPDMLHRALLPGHARWSGFFSRLRYVVIDECHGYRGVFGSHVGHVLRRLRRVVAHHAAPDARPRPVFILASATVGAPGTCASLLTGLDAEVVTEDGSPRGPLAFALWEPPLTEARGEAGARLRRHRDRPDRGVARPVGHAGRPDARLRQVPARRRDGRAGGAQVARRPRGGGEPGGRVPVRVPGRGPAPARGRPQRRRA